MKTVYFENIRNKDKFYCKNPKDTMLIDGVEYIRVNQVTNNRECLINKTFLRVISNPNSVNGKVRN